MTARQLTRRRVLPRPRYCSCQHIEHLGPCQGYAVDPQYLGYSWQSGEMWSAGEPCGCQGGTK